MIQFLVYAVVAGAGYLLWKKQSEPAPKPASASLPPPKSPLAPSAPNPNPVVYSPSIELNGKAIVIPSNAGITTSPGYFMVKLAPSGGAFGPLASGTADLIGMWSKDDGPTTDLSDINDLLTMTGNPTIASLPVRVIIPLTYKTPKELGIKE